MMVQTSYDSKYNVPDYFLKEITKKTKLVEDLNFNYFIHVFSMYHLITQSKWLVALLENEFDYDLAEKFFRVYFDDEIESLELRLCFDEVDAEVWEVIYELHCDSYVDDFRINFNVRNFLEDL